MTHATCWTKTFFCCAILALPAGALAQVGGEAGGAAGIEMGDVEESPSASGSAGAEGSGGGETESSFESSGGSSELRLGIQGRLGMALNVVPIVTPIQAGIGPSIPVVTPGVRFVDGKLFLGLGLGFAGGSNDAGGGDRGQSGFSLSPLASYDVVSESIAALSLLGWFNIASLGEQENCDAMGNCMDQMNSDIDGLGLNLGAGVRGKINEALAIGGEFGWGFMSGTATGDDYFNHGLWGALLFEASVGL